MIPFVCDDGRMEELKQAGLARRARGETFARLESDHYLTAYMANVSKPPLLREALALEAKCARQEIIIYPDEVIVGREAREAFDYDFLRAIRLWSDRLPQERQDAPPSAEASAYVTTRLVREQLGPQEWAAMEAGLAATTYSSGHTILDMAWPLQVGLRGLDEAIEARRRFAQGLDTDYYAAMKATVRAMSAFIARHADQARSMAEREADSARRRELLAIADACVWIAWQPPRSFHEALQLAWLIHVLNGCDSLGRLDQYLWPYYRQDIRSGRLSREEAAYLLCCVWCKVLEGFSIQNLTLGGTDSEGEDATNDLTYLCLETTLRLRTPQPNLSLRISPQPPAELLPRALKTVACGLGVPALYNDEVIVRALEELGIPTADARGYALAGCSQVVIPGKSHFLCDDGVLNVAKCLELALNNGVDPLTGRQIGPPTGEPGDLAGFGDVLDALRRQIDHGAEMLARCMDANDRVFAQHSGHPLRSLLVHGCLERGVAFLQGGATYNGAQAECVGITNTADSLAAIRTLVYEERSLSLAELTQVLRSNWAGHEPLALRCRNRLPRFGNDDGRVDHPYSLIAEAVYRAARRWPCRRGGTVMPGSVVFTYHVDYGHLTGATPDGRRASEPLADSAGPSQGCARSGPTAIANSLAKVDQSLAPTCVVLNIMLTRSAFDPVKLASLIESYFSRGGMQMQINVADRQTLQLARANPEKYRDLTVRVGGYSAYFAELPGDLQGEIISRTA